MKFLQALKNSLLEESIKRTDEAGEGIEINVMTAIQLCSSVNDLIRFEANRYIYTFKI